VPGLCYKAVSLYSRLVQECSHHYLLEWFDTYLLALIERTKSAYWQRSIEEGCMGSREYCRAMLCFYIRTSRNTQERAKVEKNPLTFRI
jgi:hypothetical protein